MLWDCKDVKKKLIAQIWHQDLPLLSMSWRLVNRIALQEIGYWYGGSNDCSFCLRTNSCLDTHPLLLREQMVITIASYSVPFCLRSPSGYAIPRYSQVSYPYSDIEHRFLLSNMHQALGCRSSLYQAFGSAPLAALDSRYSNSPLVEQIIDELLCVSHRVLRLAGIGGTWGPSDKR